jgi:hypothetical protein
MKRNATSISVGGWWLDTHCLTIQHISSGSYWVDAEKLDDAKIMDWVKHLSKKDYSAQDLRDFVKLAQLLKIVDVQHLRGILRASNTPVMRTLRVTVKEMKARRARGRKVRKILQQRHPGQLWISLGELSQVCDELDHADKDAQI